jgi:hypothetical protein
MLIASICFPHLTKCRIAFAKAYYVDNEHRRYSPWAYMRAIKNARTSLPLAPRAAHL